MSRPRIPMLAPKSPGPKWRARTRGEAPAISPAHSMPRAVSIWSSRPAGEPSCPSSTSRKCTCSTPSTLGTTSESTRSPAPRTMAITSSWHHSVSQPLMRTARALPAYSKRVSACTASSRPRSLAAGATESSRSRITMSAADCSAFSWKRSLVAGTDKHERRMVILPTEGALRRDPACLWERAPPPPGRLGSLARLHVLLERRHLAPNPGRVLPGQRPAQEAEHAAQLVIHLIDELGDAAAMAVGVGPLPLQRPVAEVAGTLARRRPGPDLDLDGALPGRQLEVVADPRALA